MSRPDLSIVIPVMNEEGNLTALLDEIDEAMAPRGESWEVIAVNDGSSDGSLEILEREAFQRENLRVISFPENRGQTTALFTGWREAEGRLLAAVDADLQNDPKDLLPMLDRLESEPSVDMIAGVRANRKDSVWRRIQSRIGNKARDWITGDRVTDTGCSLKMMRAECAEALPLLDGMHRFIPTLVRMRGYTVEEMDVSHRPRRAGVTKYGASNRALRGLIDCFAVRWMRSRARRRNPARIN